MQLLNLNVFLQKARKETINNDYTSWILEETAV